MKSNDLIIDKLTVDVFANQEQNLNALLYLLMDELRHMILPQVEKKMNALEPLENISIEKLDLSFNLSSIKEWKNELPAQLANQIEAAYRKQIEMISVDDDKAAVSTENIVNETPLFQQDYELVMEGEVDRFVLQEVIHFLRFGYFQNDIKNRLNILKNAFANNINVPINGGKTALSSYGVEKKGFLSEMEVYWLDSNRKPYLFKFLADFLQKNEKYQPRLIHQFSAEFIQNFLSFLANEKLAAFLLQFFNFKGGMIDLSHFLLHFLVELYDFDQKVTIEKFISELETKKFRFHQLLIKIIENDPNLIEKHHKIPQKLMKSSLSPSSDALSKLLKQRNDNKLFVFIQYLRSDFSLSEKLDPLLERFYSTNETICTITDWSSNFAEFMNSDQLITDLLIELEELMPINGQIQKPEFFATELRLLMAALEKRLLKVKGDSESVFKFKRKRKMRKSRMQSTENSKTAAKSKELLNVAPIGSLVAELSIENAGIVLLNPFFPTLLKNIGLQNSNGDWNSDQHQVLAIYLINYLVTETWEVNENELVLAKILMGYSLEEILPSLEETESELPAISLIQLSENLRLVEIPNVLKVVQNNWRPMRNCTWEGLKNDFLIRSGTLVQNEDLQYLLTIDSSALDVLLPHKKWGMNMIKYSWMDEVLNVDWEE